MFQQLPTRRLCLATCLPYVAWCLVGHWLHGLTDCGHEHRAGHCVVAHHHSGHDHGHHEHDVPCGGEGLVAAGDEHACPFCDFLRQGVTPAEIVAPPSYQGVSEFISARSVESAEGATAPVPPARGPPVV